MTAGDVTADRQFTEVHFVLGIETDDTYLDLRNEIPNDPRRIERPLEAIELDTPQIFNERLVSFFERYFHNRVKGDRFNCHRFALWMTGSDDVARKGDLRNSNRLIETIKEGRIADNGLATGQLAVVGMEGKGLLQRRYKALHSIVGLGSVETTQQCIHVQGCEGALMVTSNASASDPYIEWTTPFERAFYRSPELREAAF
jgi:hypothetical protein